MKQFEFGSCVIINIGGIGIENSLVPIPPVSFVLAFLTLCTYYKRNVKNEEDKIEEKIYLKMNFTTDYWFFDYNIALKLFNDIHKFIRKRMSQIWKKRREYKKIE